MIKANYITVTELREFNPELDFSGYSDATLSGMITRSSARVDNFINYSLSVETIELEKNEGMVSSEGNLIVYTQKLPILSISELRIKLGTSTATLSLTDGNGDARYDISARGDRVVVPYQNFVTSGTVMVTDFFSLRGREFFTQMTYVAGYGTIPSDIKDAVNLFTKDIFIRQANPMDLQSMSQGAINMNFRTRTDGKSDMVVDAEDILKEYVRYTA